MLASTDCWKKVSGIPVVVIL
jgi:hypothetical protein